MDQNELTIEILKGIRDEVRSTNVRLDALREVTEARFEETNQRLGETNHRLDRLERRQTETEVRLATELVAVVDAVHEVRDLFREDRILRERFEDHERRIRAIEARVG